MLRHLSGFKFGDFDRGGIFKYGICRFFQRGHSVEISFRHSSEFEECLHERLLRRRTVSIAHQHARHLLQHGSIEVTCLSVRSSARFMTSVEAYLKKQSRRELQSIAKRAGIRANQKSTDIVTEMLTFCKNKLKATPLVGDLLFPKTDDRDDGLVVYENRAFDQSEKGIGEDVEMKNKAVTEEVQKAYAEGRDQGIWYGRMYQKMEDLDKQWKSYLATSKRRCKGTAKQISKSPRPQKIDTTPGKNSTIKTCLKGVNFRAWFKEEATHKCT